MNLFQKLIDQQIGKATRKSARKAGRWGTRKTRQTLLNRRKTNGGMMQAMKGRGKKNERSWMGIAGTVLGSAAGIAALVAAGTKMMGGKSSEHAQSGQAPSRSHVQMSSHPAVESLGRRFRKS